jgi:hypothetical protein
LLKDQYKKGITVQNIINLSLQDDIDRANQQIYMSVPLSRKSGLVHFLTNAGPDSKVQNHHVEVEFANFGSVVFDIKKEAVNTVKNRLANGKSNLSVIANDIRSGIDIWQLLEVMARSSRGWFS